MESFLFPSDGEMEGCLPTRFPSEIQCLRVPWQDSSFSGLSVMQRDGGGGRGGGLAQGEGGRGLSSALS